MLMSLGVYRVKLPAEVMQTSINKTLTSYCNGWMQVTD